RPRTSQWPAGMWGMAVHVAFERVSGSIPHPMQSLYTLRTTVSSSHATLAIKRSLPLLGPDFHRLDLTSFAGGALTRSPRLHGAEGLREGEAERIALNLAWLHDWQFRRSFALHDTPLWRPAWR